MQSGCHWSGWTGKGDGKIARPEHGRLGPHWDGLYAPQTAAERGEAMRTWPPKNRFQFVWWGSLARHWYWRPFFVRLDPKKTSMAYIYRWWAGWGPLEIRRWETERKP